MLDIALAILRGRQDQFSQHGNGETLPQDYLQLLWTNHQPPVLSCLDLNQIYQTEDYRQLLWTNHQPLL
jgi:hypothetical protein